MSTAHRERLRELFDRAVDLPPTERAALLDEECADEPQLRHEVASLIAPSDAADEVRGRRAAAPGGAAPG